MARNLAEVVVNMLRADDDVRETMWRIVTDRLDAPCVSRNLAVLASSLSLKMMDAHEDFTQYLKKSCNDLRSAKDVDFSTVAFRLMEDVDIYLFEAPAQHIAVAFTDFEKAGRVLLETVNAESETPFVYADPHKTILCSGDDEYPVDVIMRTAAYFVTALDVSDPDRREELPSFAD